MVTSVFASKTRLLFAECSLVCIFIHAFSGKTKAMKNPSKQTNQQEDKQQSKQTSQDICNLQADKQAKKRSNKKQASKQACKQIHSPILPAKPQDSIILSSRLKQKPVTQLTRKLNKSKSAVEMKTWIAALAAMNEKCEPCTFNPNIPCSVASQKWCKTTKSASQVRCQRQATNVHYRILTGWAREPVSKL